MDWTLRTLFGALFGPMSTPSVAGFLGHVGLANLAAISPKNRQKLLAYQCLLVACYQVLYLEHCSSL